MSVQRLGNMPMVANEGGSMLGGRTNQQFEINT
jgi:hypothetical protein